MIPDSIRAALGSALGAAIQDARPVQGGDINQAARLTLQGGEAVFLKWHSAAPPGMFAAEAHGLALLAGADAVRVPGVLAEGEDFLALEWIEEARSGVDRDRFAENFGRALAALHHIASDKHGLDHDNFIGRLPQPNTPSASWTAFYRDRRIGAQMEIARTLGRLPPAREAALTRLQDWLDVFLDDAIMLPSLLHGDLWSGNYMIAPGDQPVLVDPAAYYGHREVEMAFTELFGGFPRRFYDAYNEAYPLDPGYAQRRLLYQLYPLLVHLNHFGGHYAAQVDRVMQHYLG